MLIFSRRKQIPRDTVCVDAEKPNIMNCVLTAEWSRNPGILEIVQSSQPEEIEAWTGKEIAQLTQEAELEDGAPGFQFGPPSCCVDSTRRGGIQGTGEAMAAG